jgi:hypothetical protein
MAVLSLTDQLTSLEVAKRTKGFSEDARRIIEELNQHNELLIDAPLVEANEGTVHSTLVRTALPHGQHRGYNQGVGKASSQTKSIKDVISNIEIYSEVDAQMIDNTEHGQDVLASEQVAFIEGLGQDMAEDLMYGNHEADERETNGFATRYHDTQSGQSKNCISLGGSGNALTSIYLIKWATDKAHLIYPKGAKNAGIEYKFLGEQTCDAPDGNGKYQALVSHYRVSRGLAIRNSMSVIRLCNIDVTANGIGDKIAEYVVKNIGKLATGGGTVSIACNAEVKGILNWAANQKSNVIYPAEDPWGNSVMKIGVGRIRECLAITLAESAIS